MVDQNIVHASDGEAVRQPALVRTPSREVRAGVALAQTRALAARRGGNSGALPDTSGALGWISLAALAQMLGRDTYRAARDWCNRHGVPYRRDGKHAFARVEDVQRAIEALPVRGAEQSEAATRSAAARAAAAIMSGKR